MDADSLSSGPFDDEAFDDGVHELVTKAIANNVEPNELVAILEKQLTHLRGSIAETDRPGQG